jgi:hypothetical protein
MQMRVLWVAITVALPLPAMSQSLETMTLANNLGSVLASEEKCGLSFNQKAIEAFIEKKVSADDMGFASTLNTMTSGSKAQLQRMSQSALTAHCTQIRRVAKSYGFTE